MGKNNMDWSDDFCLVCNRGARKEIQHKHGFASVNCEECGQYWVTDEGMTVIHTQLPMTLIKALHKAKKRSEGDGGMPTITYDDLKD